MDWHSPAKREYAPAGIAPAPERRSLGATTLTAMKAHRHIKQRLIRDECHADEAFERYFYQEVQVWSSLYERCTWRQCKFNKTSFSNATVFRHARFERCRFWGQHTHMGGPSVFEHCEFSECAFSDVTFWGATLRHCRITGSLTNISFCGPEAPPDWICTFDHVDLTGARLQLVEFTFGFDLATTHLPNEIDHGENDRGA